MWNPTENWLPASSYVEPVTPPDVEPDATPEVSLCFSKAWLPYILGSLQQLTQPTTWDTSDPTVLQTALERSQQLLSMFGAAEGCMEIRWSTDACAIQVSTDDGATWEDITGWDLAAVAACIQTDLLPYPQVRWDGTDCVFQISTDGGSTWTTMPGFTIDSLAGCIQVPLIDIGGAPGTGFNGPYPPVGTGTDQVACNIANWLGVEILQGSMSSLATSIGATATTLEAALGLFGLAASFTGVGGLFFDVAGIFIAAGTAIGETALNTAASDSTLRGDLICAIYEAIRLDGKVTAANEPTIITNINAISYATPGIVGLLSGYVSGLGYAGLNAIQSEGALYQGDCSACANPPGDWCYHFDFTASEQGWSLVYPSGDDGHYVSGTGWEGDVDSGSGFPQGEVDIIISFPSVVVDYIAMHYDRPATDSHSFSFVRWYSGGTGGTLEHTGAWFDLATGPTTDHSTTAGVPVDTCWVRLCSNGSTPNVPIIEWIEMHGPPSSPNPFGSSNCTP